MSEESPSDNEAILAKLDEAREKIAKQRQEQKEAMDAQKSSRGLFSWLRRNGGKKADPAEKTKETEAPKEQVADFVPMQVPPRPPELPRRRMVLTIIIMLMLIVVIRLGFGAALDSRGPDKVTEVTALMELDRAFGWLLAPLMALFVAIGSMDIESSRSRVRFVVVGVVFAILLLVLPIFLSNYVSTLDTTDLEAARTRKNLGLKVWHWRLIEIGLTGIACLVLFMMRKRG